MSDPERILLLTTPTSPHIYFSIITSVFGPSAEVMLVLNNCLTGLCVCLSCLSRWYWSNGAHCSNPSPIALKLKVYGTLWSRPECLMAFTLTAYAMSLSFLALRHHTTYQILENTDEFRPF